LNFFGLKKGSRNRPSLLDELTDFYRQNRKIVYQYFIRLTYSSQESEELTQETFYQAVKSIHRFKGESSLKTWLLQIARNVYRNKVRSLTKDRAYVSDAADMSLLPDESRNPAEIAFRDQTRNEIRSVLQQLPDDYRDVLIFREIEGLSHDEIANILRKTPQTTRVLLHRAKARFRDLYEKEVTRPDESV
jgi:RNA polymerase sigma-70 factor (ECF subfamily)